MTDIMNLTIGNASGALLVDNIRNQIKDIIEKARNTGDYLLFKGVTELKSIIDSWENANTNLLETLFDELDEAQQTFFLDMESLLDKIAINTENTTEEVHKIVESLQQTANVFNNKFALLRYSPRVVYPGMIENIVLTIRGINVDTSDPKIILPDGSNATRRSLVQQEANFSIPRSVFKFDDPSITFSEFALEYTESSLLGIIKKNHQINIAIMLLPQQLATYSLQATTKQTHRQTETFTKEFHYSARGDCNIFNQNPHANDWKIDVSSLKQVNEWGDSGRGCSVTNITEHGFSIQVCVNTVREFLNPNAPGYQHCVWQWNEFKETEITQTEPPQNGIITWTNDVPLDLPKNVENWKLTIQSFDGFERVITGNDIQPFFSVTKNNDFIVIRPQIPDNLNCF